jgi:hypothetical protein
MDKMTQLAALLVDHDMVDELELAELYREMGQPLKSRAKVAKVDEADRMLCGMQLSLIEKGYQGPARFNY